MNFLEKVNIYPPDPNYATIEQKFIAIFMVDEKSVTDTTGKFIYTCLNKRNICTVITIKPVRAHKTIMQVNN